MASGRILPTTARALLNLRACLQAPGKALKELSRIERVTEGDSTGLVSPVSNARPSLGWTRTANCHAVG